jgi:hypothetical protein
MVGISKCGYEMRKEAEATKPVNVGKKILAKRSKSKKTPRKAAFSEENERLVEQAEDAEKNHEDS